MLEKNVIYAVKNCTTPGFCSRFFLVPKPSKNWHPVIDPSVVNEYLLVPTFKMETAEIIRNSVTTGEWLVSTDLTDADFHKPIHKESDGQTCQFQELPLGLATAHLELTRVVREAKLIFNLAEFELDIGCPVKSSYNI